MKLTRTEEKLLDVAVVCINARKNRPCETIPVVGHRVCTWITLNNKSEIKAANKLIDKGLAAYLSTDEIILTRKGEFFLKYEYKREKAA